MAQRLKQMAITNSGEHKINWSTRLGSSNNRHKVVKSVGNLVFARGDAVYSNQEAFDAAFNDPYLYCQDMAANCKIVKDSHKLF